MKNNLYANAFFLMLSAFAAAATGLLFWILVTRTYDTAAVGLATTLLSVSGLLSLLGLAGFDTTLVRFLPRAQRKNDYINSAYILVTILSVTLSVSAGLILPLLSPNLSVLSNPWVFAGFVVFTVASSLSLLTNAVFLAFKKARYIFTINALFGAVKVLLAVIVARGDAMTIFVIVGVSQIIGLAFGLLRLRRAFNYRFSLRLHIATLRAVKKFSLFMYASSVLNLLPPTILPLLIVHSLGLKEAAYYYMAFTIASILYTIAYASMQSMFAEGSHNEAAMSTHIKKVTKLITLLLLPAAAAIYILSNFLLTIFGHEYGAEAGSLLRLFAVAALPVATYSALGAIFKVTHNLRGAISMNVVYVTTILGFSVWLVPVLGLTGVGWAWTIGNTAACIVGLFFLVSTKNKREES